MDENLLWVLKIPQINFIHTANLATLIRHLLQVQPIAISSLISNNTLMKMSVLGMPFVKDFTANFLLETRQANPSCDC